MSASDQPLHDRALLLHGAKRDQVLTLREVEQYGIDSFADPNYISIYGMTPGQWYDRGIRLLGNDTPTPSRDYYDEHHILLSKPAEVVVVESLAHLDQVPDEFTLVAFPLNFHGRDGSPIRAVALVD